MKDKLMVVNANLYSDLIYLKLKEACAKPSGYRVRISKHKERYFVRTDFPWILYLPRLSYLAFKY